MRVIEPEPGTAEDRRRWERCYVEDVDAIGAMLGSDGIAVAGRRIAVVDSGDGILALGLAQRLGAGEVVGFDDAGCNTVTLATWAGRYARSEELPGGLRFVATQPYALPGERGSFDLAVWWGDLSARRDPVRMLMEVRRIVVPQGHVLLRVPADGPLGLDQVQHAVLAAGLAPVRVDLDAVTVRPTAEQWAETVSGLVTRGARVLAYRL